MSTAAIEDRECSNTHAKWKGHLQGRGQQAAMCAIPMHTRGSAGLTATSYLPIRNHQITRYTGEASCSQLSFSGRDVASRVDRKNTFFGKYNVLMPQNSPYGTKTLYAKFGLDL